MIGNPRTIRSEGYKALARELGVAGAIEFLRQVEAGSGNYTEEREKIQNEITIDEIVESIKRRNAQM